MTLTRGGTRYQAPQFDVVPLTVGPGGGLTWAVSGQKDEGKVVFTNTIAVGVGAKTYPPPTLGNPPWGLDHGFRK